MNKWSAVYEGAYREDGSLLFPEKLTKEFLENIRKTQGLYKFSNQYLNIIVPDEEQDFKRSWIKYYDQLPETYYTFVFIDPAISLNDGADYTATIVVHTDSDQKWYVEMAYRQRITATETVNWIFKVNQAFRPMAIGIEGVAYQQSLIHFVAEEMRRRNQVLPIKDIRRSNIKADGSKQGNNSKPFRIRSLVPRFEFGQILLNQGLDDFLLEYHSFPRGAHDDLLDALASIDEIAHYPDKPKEKTHEYNPAHPDYERYYIRNLLKTQRAPSED